MYMRPTVSWSLEGRTYMSIKRIPLRTRHDRGSTEGVFRSARGRILSCTVKKGRKQWLRIEDFRGAGYSLDWPRVHYYPM